MKKLQPPSINRPFKRAHRSTVFTQHYDTTEVDGLLYCNDGDWVESCTAIVETYAGDLRVVRWQEAPPTPVRERDRVVALAPDDERRRLSALQAEYPTALMWRTGGGHGPIVRTPEEFAQSDIEVHTRHEVVAIDTSNSRVTVRDLESGAERDVPLVAERGENNDPAVWHRVIIENNGSSQTYAFAVAGDYTHAAGDYPDRVGTRCRVPTASTGVSGHQPFDSIANPVAFTTRWNWSVSTQSPLPLR